MIKKVLGTDTMKYHPITDGEQVFMEDGRTSDISLSTECKYTDILNNNGKSMFRIDGADGYDCLDGVYESLVFKGRSLVNLITRYQLDVKEKVFTVGSSPSARTYLVADRRSVLLKPDTKYLIQFNVSKLNLDGLVSIDFFFQHNSDTIFKGSTTAKVTHNGVYRAVVTTLSPLPSVDSSNWSSNAFIIKGSGSQWENTGSTIRTLTVSDVMVLEYQEGMENWDIPYFEGMASCKMPVLTTTGKNLISEVVRGYIAVNSFFTDNQNSRVCIAKVPTNTAITISGENINRTVIATFNSKPKYRDKSIRRIESRTITTNNDENWIVWYCTSNVNETGEPKNVQVEIGTQSTSFEPFKSNVLRTPEEIVLREVNRVKDTYNALTGEYVQRIGEIVITSAVSKGIVVLDNNIRANIAVSSLNGGNGTTKVNNTLSDKFYWSEANAKDNEGLCVNDNTLHWCINKSRLTSHDLQGVNTWLQSNPITVQYELAEPITKVIKPSIAPFAYRYGHVILESGFNGQSLLPEIEYSLIRNIIGQIESSQDMIQQHESLLLEIDNILNERLPLSTILLYAIERQLYTAEIMQTMLTYFKNSNIITVEEYNNLLNKI